MLPARENWRPPTVLAPEARHARVVEEIKRRLECSERRARQCEDAKWETSQAFHEEHIQELAALLEVVTQHRPLGGGTGRCKSNPSSPWPCATFLACEKILEVKRAE